MNEYVNPTGILGNFMQKEYGDVLITTYSTLDNVGVRKVTIKPGGKTQKHSHNDHNLTVVYTSGSGVDLQYTNNEKSGSIDVGAGTMCLWHFEKHVYLPQGIEAEFDEHEVRAGDEGLEFFTFYDKSKMSGDDLDKLHNT